MCETESLVSIFSNQACVVGQLSRFSLSYLAALEPSPLSLSVCPSFSISLSLFSFSISLSLSLFLFLHFLSFCFSFLFYTSLLIIWDIWISMLWCFWSVSIFFYLLLILKWFQLCVTRGFCMLLYNCLLFQFQLGWPLTTEGFFKLFKQKYCQKHCFCFHSIFQDVWTTVSSLKKTTNKLKTDVSWGEYNYVFVY